MKVISTCDSAGRGWHVSWAVVTGQLGSQENSLSLSLPADYKILFLVSTGQISFDLCLEGTSELKLRVKFFKL